MSWKSELKRRITGRAELEKIVNLTPEEAAWFEKAQGFRKGGGQDELLFPLCVPRGFLLLAGPGADDPIRRQCIPRAEEFRLSPGELHDPLGDKAHSPLSRLVHRYADRALVLVTGECALSCRYCFRRYYSGGGKGSISEPETGAIAEYLKSRPAIREVILSGGDPLTVDDQRLFSLIDTLRAARPGLILRLSSRMPSALPSRITPSLCRGLARRQPLWGVVHINHPKEFSPACSGALRRLVSSGVPLLGQTVLLAGVNDDAAVLEELFRGLAARGVKPYYLFQGDMAPGTAHFRVPLPRGWEIMRALRKRLSALALPEYAVDLPGGGGKVPLATEYLKGEDEDFWIFENIEGKEFRYPREKT
ncbi:MAG: KamA family radical SAM protein [Spirochaetales bacterium]|nr:KamA family radical SAM protein [Spirochaetales bacterium]